MKGRKIRAVRYGEQEDTFEAALSGLSVLRSVVVAACVPLLVPMSTRTMPRALGTAPARARSGRSPRALARATRQTYQLVGSRSEILRVRVDDLNESRVEVSVSMRSAGVAAAGAAAAGRENGDGRDVPSLRWWTINDGGEMEVSEELATACESTKMAGNALVSPFAHADDGGGEYCVSLTLPKVASPSRFGFNVTYVHEGRPILSRPRDHAYYGVPLGFYPGTPYPLGAHRQGDWVNFAVLGSASVAPPRIHFFEIDPAPGAPRASLAFRVLLDPTLNRTGDLWHCALRVPETVDAYAICYDEIDPSDGYTIASTLAADPFGDNVCRATLDRDDLASTLTLLPPTRAEGGESLEDWEEDGPLGHTMSKAVVMEMDLRRGDASGDPAEDAKGKDEEDETLSVFEVVEAAAADLEDSGVTALAVRGLLSEEALTSAAPLSHPSAGLGSEAFKRLVLSLHRMDLELYLQLDCLRLQTVLRVSHLNEGAAIQALKESVRFLVSEYHLDGICFLHAEKLTHGDFGVVLDRPPVVEDLCQDPILRQTKMIAVPFGSHLLPREGLRGFPHWGRWAEANTRFVQDMQALFLGGDEGGMGKMAAEAVGADQQVDLANVSMRLTGSADLFQKWDDTGSFHLFTGRPPFFGLNSASLLGDPPLDQAIRVASSASAAPWPSELTETIRWSLLASVFVSQGVPVVRLLDLSGERWAEDLSLFSKLCHFRECYADLLQQDNFESPRDLRWHGMDPLVEPLWQQAPASPATALDAVPASVPEGGPVAGKEAPLAPRIGPEQRFVAMSVWSGSQMDAIYVAFSGNPGDVSVRLPQPQIGHRWFVLLDTGRIPSCLSNEKVEVKTQEYVLKPKSALILVMQRPKDKSS